MIVNEGIGGKKLPVLTNPAAASDLLLDKQLIDSEGNVMTGTMPIVSHPNPSIIVGANGLITASHEQSTGKVTGGTTQATHQLDTVSGTTITPSTYQQLASPSGRFTTGNLYVAGDSNLIASNIKSGVSIFGVYGTYKGEGLDVKFAWNTRSISRGSYDSTTVTFPGILTEITEGLLAVSITSSAWWTKDSVRSSSTNYLIHASGGQKAPTTSLIASSILCGTYSYGSVDLQYGLGGYVFPTMEVSGTDLIFNGQNALYVAGLSSDYYVLDFFCLYV